MHDGQYECHLGDCLEAGTTMLVNFAFGARCGEIVIDSIMWFSAPRYPAVPSSYNCNPIS
jgi:hypothetical protein